MTVSKINNFVLFFLLIIALESLVMEGSSTGKGILENKDEKTISLVRKKSQIEAELWRSFDKFTGLLVMLFEKQSEYFIWISHLVPHQPKKTSINEINHLAGLLFKFGIANLANNRVLKIMKKKNLYIFKVIYIHLWKLPIFLPLYKL